MGCFEVYPSTCFSDGGAAQSITARLKNTYCCFCVCACVCPHLAAWLHMLSTLAIKVEPCALCSYYVLLQNIKMISSSILPFYLKKKMFELLTCSLIISYICILCMAFLTNFLFFHSIYLFTGFQLLLHTSYVVCVCWGRKLIESWAIIGCQQWPLHQKQKTFINVCVKEGFIN
jgi:hypothetical protein